MPNKDILLVENDPDDCELMKLAFSEVEVSHNLIVVSSAKAALSYLQQEMNGEAVPTGDRVEKSLPALIILDLNLPQINGIEVLQRIRASPRTRILPVVMLSSSDEPQDLIDSYINGCNSYIRKPIHFTQLQAFVREISRYWLTVNQLPVFGVPNE